MKKKKISQNYTQLLFFVRTTYDETSVKLSNISGRPSYVTKINTLLYSIIIDPYVIYFNYYFLLLKNIFSVFYIYQFFSLINNHL